MDQDFPIIYGLEFQARALTCYLAETELIQFFAGTQSLRCQNQVHLITFDDETNSISKRVFMHPDGEIWNLTSPASQRNMLASVYNQGTKTTMKACVWKFSIEENNIGCELSLLIIDYIGCCVYLGIGSVMDDEMLNAPSLQEVTRIDCPEFGDIKSFLWYPSQEKTEFVVLVESHLLLCDLESSGASAKVVSQASLEGKLQPKFTSGCWDPHHNCSQLATAHDTIIRGWDLRTLQTTYSIENAHGHLVRNLDFNPNKQYLMASCGDDCKVKFWDLRKVSSPIKTLNDHSHWVWNVKYNHFHDQLVLTSSSDGRVVLTNLSSISSEPYGNLAVEDDDDCEAKSNRDIERNDGLNFDSRSETLTDGVILKFEEHEDSVYGVEWSSADPWVFASLSYDGRLVVNRVPRRVKYQILL